MAFKRIVNLLRGLPGSIRVFVGKAVEQLLSSCLGESVAEHNGKLIHG